MMQVEMYGIANCDTIKKARKWLEGKGIKYTFHDYKKEGANARLLAEWCDTVGWETLLNRRGTTWRKLPESDKESVDQAKAIALMVRHPAMIRRPIIAMGNQVTAGFSVEVYEKLFR